MKKIKTLNLHLTNRCNMLCRHCLYSAGEKKMEEMSYKEIKKLINEFAELSGKRGTLNLFGGEIFLRDDIFNIIDFAIKNDLKVGITTNANFSERIMNDLCKRDINRLTVDINGHNAKNHEFLSRKSGHFKKSVSAIRKFLKEGKFTTSNVILFKDNSKEIEDILYLCQKIGINIVSFYLFTPLGRGKSIKDLMIGPEEWKKLKTRVKKWIKKNKPQFGIIWEKSYEYKNLLNEMHLYLCSGKEADVIDIRCDGNVFYCGLLSSTEIGCLGNIKKKKLQTILNTRKKKAININIGCPAIAWNNGDRNDLVDPRKSSKDIIPVCPYYWEVLNRINPETKKKFAHINL